MYVQWTVVDFDFKRVKPSFLLISNLTTLDSGINVGVRLLIFEKIWSKKKIENDCNA